MWGPLAWNSLSDTLRDPFLYSNSFWHGLNSVVFVRYSVRSAVEMLHDHDTVLHECIVDIDIVDVMLL